MARNSTSVNHGKVGRCVSISTFERSIGAPMRHGKSAAETPNPKFQRPKSNSDDLGFVICLEPGVWDLAFPFPRGHTGCSLCERVIASQSHVRSGHSLSLPALQSGADCESGGRRLVDDLSEMREAYRDPEIRSAERERAGLCRRDSRQTKRKRIAARRSHR